MHAAIAVTGNPRTILTHLFRRLPNGVRLAALGATVAVNRSADRSAFSPPMTAANGNAKVDHGSGGTVPFRRSKTLPIWEPFPVTGRAGGFIP